MKPDRREPRPQGADRLRPRTTWRYRRRLRFAYLHGFASGPLTKKGQHLLHAFERAGHPFSLPDLNVPSFAELSLSAMLERVDRLDAEEGDDEGWAFVGSSLGGWLASRWAMLNPTRVPRLLLLCPAFDIAERWPTILPPGAMETWRQGSLRLPDRDGELHALHYRFYEESREQPAFPDVPCPTRIVHGIADDRVPIESSRRYAEERENVSLLEVDDGHDLWASIELIEREALSLAIRASSQPAPHRAR